MVYKDIFLIINIGQHVAGYLEDLGRKTSIRDWQHLQAIDVIRLLFVVIVKSKRA